MRWFIIVSIKYTHLKEYFKFSWLIFSLNQESIFYKLLKKLQIT
jgi:hypothetical protein